MGASLVFSTLSLADSFEPSSGELFPVSFPDLAGGHRIEVLQTDDDPFGEWFNNGDENVTVERTFAELGPLNGLSSPSALFSNQLTITNHASFRQRVNVMMWRDYGSDSFFSNARCVPDDPAFKCDFAAFDAETQTMVGRNQFNAGLFATSVSTDRDAILAYYSNSFDKGGSAYWRFSFLDVSSDRVFSPFDIGLAIGVDLGYLDPGESADVEFKYLVAPDLLDVPGNFRSEIGASAVPTPASLPLLVLGMAGLWFNRIIRMPTCTRQSVAPRALSPPISLRAPESSLRYDPPED